MNCPWHHPGKALGVGVGAQDGPLLFGPVDQLGVHVDGEGQITRYGAGGVGKGNFLLKHVGQWQADTQQRRNLGGEGTGGIDKTLGNEGASAIRAFERQSEAAALVDCPHLAAHQIDTTGAYFLEHHLAKLLPRDVACAPDMQDGPNVAGQRRKGPADQRGTVQLAGVMRHAERAVAARMVK